MLPITSGGMGRDWLTVLTCAAWGSALLIMLLAKLKAVHDGMIMFVILVVVAMVNMEEIMGKIASRRFHRLFLVLRSQLRKEFKGTFALSLVILLAVQITNFGLFSLSESMQETNAVFSTAIASFSAFVCFGWIYQVVSILIYWQSSDHMFHANPIVTLAVCHGTKGRKILTKEQIYLYFVFQGIGLLCGFLSHTVLTAFWKEQSALETVKVSALSAVELVIASAANYYLTKNSVRQHNKKVI